MMNARPLHPGEAIRQCVLEPYGLTQDQLAKRLHLSRLTIHQLVRGRRSLTPDVALRLARLTRTDAADWLRLQTDLDIWEARQRPDLFIEEIVPLHHRGPACAPWNR